MMMMWMMWMMKDVDDVVDDAWMIVTCYVMGEC